MENLPGNSHKAQKISYSDPSRVNAPEAEEKPAVKRVERIVEGGVVQRKKPLGKRFANTFFGGDAKSAATHVYETVIITTLRDLLANSLETGINQMIYGQSRPPAGSSIGSSIVSGLGKFSYDKISSGPSKSGGLLGRGTVDSHVQNNRSDFDDIVLASRVEADAVLEQMFRLLLKYEVVTVGDLYDMLGISTRNYQVGKFGWTSLQSAAVRRTRGGGYLLDLPSPEFLDR